MSSTSSAALADSVSDLSEQECEQLPSAKSSRTAAPSLRSDGPECPSTQTFANSGCQLDLLMSSVEDSPARTSALLVTAQGSLGRAAASGASTTASSAKSGRRGSSSKTSAPFALEDWTECSGNSLRSGMTRSGTAYPLPPLARLTGEIESGLLPTPSASSYGSNRGGAAGRVGPVRHSLQSMAKHGLWPTPTSRDWKDGSAASCRNVPVNCLLGRAVHQGSHAPGSLNPAFVEWLMGFPLGWTVLEPSETPSSRRSRKSSGAQSSRGSSSNE
jgi:hypothetical protein